MDSMNKFYANNRIKQNLEYFISIHSRNCEYIPFINKKQIVSSSLHSLLNPKTPADIQHILKIICSPLSKEKEEYHKISLDDKCKNTSTEINTYAEYVYAFLNKQKMREFKPGNIKKISHVPNDNLPSTRTNDLFDVSSTAPMVLDTDPTLDKEFISDDESIFLDSFSSSGSISKQKDGFSTHDFSSLYRNSDIGILKNFEKHFNDTNNREKKILRRFQNEIEDILAEKDSADKTIRATEIQRKYLSLGLDLNLLTIPQEL